jgi:hypothetical protein
VPLSAEAGAEAGSRMLVRLALDAGGGNAVEAELLRGQAWLAAQEAEMGRTVYLDLPEMGLRGEALVTAIEPCPPLEAGEGRLVTGAFRHSRGVVYDLAVEGEGKLVGVTGTHPFWSEDRLAWVPAKELSAGERLRGLGGAPAVRALALRAGPEPVYNIEVEGDHCYRVGRQGLLVHNSSADDPCDPEDKCVKDTGNDPCWKLSGKYKYDSAEEACAAFGTKPKVKPVEMYSKPNDCKGDGPSYHVTCEDDASGAHDSAISCDCCDKDGMVVRKWKLARS